ncbi:MAG: Panacea domain-containing protein [Methyloligella sp. ZOD6]
MPASSPAIANEFIRLAAKNGQKLTQMQLQKLVYIAHGWNLAVNGEPLTADSPCAWDYGPVYRDLRDALQGQGSKPVEREIPVGSFGGGVFLDGDEGKQPARAKLSEEASEVVKRVFADYGKYHAFSLSALTHREGTPWSKVYKDGAGRFEAIPDELIREHFLDIAKTRSERR